MRHLTSARFDGASGEGVAVIYDQQGRRVDINRASSFTTYAYDAENRLIGSSTGALLVYDPLGRLFQTSGGAFGVTQFLYDGAHVVAEYDGANGSLRRHYMWGPGADEPILADEGSAVSCAGTRFLHTDERGSIVALANCTGSRLSVQNYDEQGVPDTTNAQVNAGGRFGYTGQMWVPELGLWYYKARMYSPTLGRFMQTDPIGYADGMNWYNHVGSDPVNRSDPSGLGTFRYCPPYSGNTISSVTRKGKTDRFPEANNCVTIEVPDDRPAPSGFTPVARRMHPKGCRRAQSRKKSSHQSARQAK